jgi:hypothetical protein
MECDMVATFRHRFRSVQKLFGISDTRWHDSLDFRTVVHDSILGDIDAWLRANRKLEDSFEVSRFQPDHRINGIQRNFWTENTSGGDAFALVGRRIMAEAKILHIQAVTIAFRFDMSGNWAPLQSAFDWKLFPV